MTIERWIFSPEPHNLLSKEQLAVGTTINLGRSSLNEGFLGSELSEGYEHEVTVISHDSVVDKVAPKVGGGGNFHTKTKDYINQNPPLGMDAEGNITVLVWQPTAYGENGDKQTLSFPLVNLK